MQERFQRIFVTAILLLCAFLLSTAGNSHGAPNLINFQGELTDTLSAPVPDGGYPMTFRILDADLGGTVLWEETQVVIVTNGIYNVLLGNGTTNGSYGAFDPSLFSADDRWLEVMVDTEVLTPRQRVTSVAFSLQAEEAVHAASADSATSALNADTVDGFEGAALDQSAHVANSTIHQPQLSEAQTEVYITNGPLDLSSGTTLGGDDISTGPHTTTLPWSSLTSVPAGFADGLDNDTDTNTTYSAGTGLNLTGTTFNVVSPLDLSTSGFDPGPAVKGTHSFTGNYGYLGEEFNGVYGYTTSSSNDAIAGINAGSNTEGYLGGQSEGVFGFHQGGNLGRLGTPQYGVFGQSSSGDAGHFIGNVHVQGNLSATGSKPFIQPHATDPSKEIVYIAAEAPEAMVVYHGTASLKKGRAVITFPDYFSQVASEEGMRVQVTPLEDCNGMFVPGKSRGEIRVKELMGGKSNARFDYYVTAVRAGFEEHEPVVENKHFKPGLNETVREFEARYEKDDLSTRAIRQMLISNGILTEDGRLDMAKVKELGWTVAEEGSVPNPQLRADLP